MNLLFIGKPGCGKGTLSQLLGEEGYIALSTGNLLRKAATQDTPKGREIKALVDQGKFADDPTIFAMVGEWMRELPENQTVILDGFPRNMAQAQAVLAGESAGVEIHGVVHFNVDDETALMRASGRILHLASGRIYHETLLPPKVAGKDDATGESLTKRADDKPEIIKERLALYEKTTAPVLDLLREAGIPVLELDAQGMDRKHQALAIHAWKELLSRPAKTHKMP